MRKRSPPSSRNRSAPPWPSPPARHRRAAAPRAASRASADRSTTIWAEPETNALVITAPAKIMRSLMSVVDKLDIRRMQVLVEAIIVDINVNKNAELGVNWAVWSDDDDTRIPLGTFQQPVGGVNLASLAQSIDNPCDGEPVARHRHHLRHRPHRHHRRELRRHVARDPGRFEHQHHRHAVRGHDGQPGSGAQGRAGSAVRHRLVQQHRQHRQQRRT